MLLFFVNVLNSLRHGAPSGPDPWGGATLEWSLPSPPPPYNFAVIPTIASREPLWEDQLGERDERSNLTRGMLLDQGRETIATTPLDAEPERILEMPEDSYAPLLLALSLGILFTGLLLRMIPLGAIGALGIAGSLLLWLWPRRGLLEREPTPAEAANG